MAPECWHHYQEAGIIPPVEEPMMRGTTQPMPTVQRQTTNSSPVEKQPSYYMTHWALLNQALAIVEERTDGRAGVIQRFATFLIVGGIAALVNLTIFQLGLLLLAPLKIATLSPNMNAWLQNLAAYIVAAEISIIANFVLNDPITFSHLPGHDRPWLERCLRFHVTCILGVIVTFAIENVMHFVVGVPALFAEATGIIIALFFNFTVHHLFTYRHTAR
jgi:putative flippase GtrA